mmetsp:Transcript_1001/g.1749  ORF Transcript_1001/g.1749 Transcript_1001/m.1749 type:complete len:387 (+) Transcript_1001:97-1257(+)
MVERATIFTSVFLAVCAVSAIYLRQFSNRATNTLRNNGRSIFVQRRLRTQTEDGAQDTSPMVPLESVGGHIPWLHIEKTGSSFVNVLLHYACANAPSDEAMAGGPHHWEHRTSVSEYECSDDYTFFPYLYPANNLDYKDFHAPLFDAIYEHNKGNLVGMLRDPRSHRLSFAKHKYLEQYGSDGWIKFTSKRGYSETDKSLRVFLEYMKGFETAVLAGQRPIFRSGLDKKKERAVIDLAKQRLREGFQYIGITDRYLESVCLFYSKFSKPGDDSGADKTCKPVVFMPVNVASDHMVAFNFTDADWEYYEDYDDKIDREIFEFATELFEADLLRYGVTRESCIARGCWPEDEVDDSEGSNKDAKETSKQVERVDEEAEDEISEWEESG